MTDEAFGPGLKYGEIAAFKRGLKVVMKNHGIGSGRKRWKQSIWPAEKAIPTAGISKSPAGKRAL